MFLTESASDVNYFVCLNYMFLKFSTIIIDTIKVVCLLEVVLKGFGHQFRVRGENERTCHSSSDL